MACRLLNANTSPEPMLNNCQVDYQEQTLARFKRKYTISFQRNAFGNAACQMSAFLFKPLYHQSGTNAAQYPIDNRHRLHRASWLVWGSVWPANQGPILQTVYKLTINSQSKSYKNKSCPKFNTDAQFRPQICKCHDGSTVTKCAYLWPG